MPNGEKLRQHLAAVAQTLEISGLRPACKHATEVNLALMKLANCR
jgi:hypothetical protein